MFGKKVDEGNHQQNERDQRHADMPKRNWKSRLVYSPRYSVNPIDLQYENKRALRQAWSISGDWVVRKPLSTRTEFAVSSRCFARL
jgi:hypothetical protein